MSEHKPLQEKEEDRPEGYIRRRIIIAFSVFVMMNLLAIGAWHWLRHQPDDKGIPHPLRTVLAANEKVNKQFFSEQHLVKEFPKKEAAKEVRVNGDIGVPDEIDGSTWRLRVTRHSEDSTNDSTFELTLGDIMAMQKRELIFDFKCVEGWSQVSHWGGVRFSDFMEKYHLGTHSGKASDPDHPEDLYKYVGLETPDTVYYVGIDMKSMMHPQTLLAYEVNGRSLPVENGYPLRLIIPLKYGIKSLKCIGHIFFSDSRPRDYWFERGYDYDAAL
jgi:DMSO/TMAO reductase YedYZ molybdopterin-dependent catalytic subunit